MPEPLDRSQWGARTDGSSKGDGFLGVLVRPDGRVSSEISIGTADLIPGQEVEIPTLVPSLSAAEVRKLLAQPETDPIPDAIADKAIAFAKYRLAKGLPVFAQPGEQQHHIYPDLPRADAPGGFSDANIRPMKAHR